MTAQQIARTLNSRLVRNGKGFQCSCPVKLRHEHGDRNRSLSIVERDGWVRLKCFTGCTRGEILAAMGLKVRDLALNEFKRNLEWEQRKRDEDRLAKLEYRHGLVMMAQVVIPEERRYWAAVERNIAVEIRVLRDTLFPEEKERRLRESEVQRIIAEYGEEELLECADPGYPLENGPHNLPIVWWQGTRIAGRFQYFISGLQPSAGKYAGQRRILIYEVIP
jgi:hypothetical protein